MVLVLLTEDFDPVTSLAFRDGKILVGTACGAVRLLFTKQEQKQFSCITLTKRSPESVVAQLIEDNFVYAVIGDVSVRRWALDTLQYDTPLVKGCKFDEVVFVMKHAFGQCTSSASLLADRSICPMGPRIMVMRQTGECCGTDLSECLQRLHENVGPMPDIDTQLHPICFTGDNFIWALNKNDEYLSFKAWRVWESPSQIPWNLQLYTRGSQIGGVESLNANMLLLLKDSSLLVLQIGNDHVSKIRKGPKGIFLFTVLRSNGKTILVWMSKKGQIGGGELSIVSESTEMLVSYQDIAISRRISARPRFLIGYAYFLSVSLPPCDPTKISIAFNDDIGVHVEECVLQI